MAAAKKGELVPRPPKRIEYEIRFATGDSQKGWRDLVATIRNSCSRYAARCRATTVLPVPGPPSTTSAPEASARMIAS